MTSDVKRYRAPSISVPVTPHDGMNRFWALASALFISAVAGTGYAFGVYSQQLKELLGFTQQQTSTTGSLGNVGLFCGMACGLIYGRYGPRSTILLGAATIFGGYFTLWLILAEHIPSQVWLVYLCVFVAQFGSCCLTTSCTSTSVRNLPCTSRGQAVGLSKGMFGLSSSMLGVMYKGFMEGKPVMFVFVLAVYVPAMALIGCYPLKLNATKPTNASPAPARNDDRTIAIPSDSSSRPSFAPATSTSPSSSAPAISHMSVSVPGRSTPTPSFKWWIVNLICLGVYLLFCSLLLANVELSKGVKIVMTAGMFPFIAVVWYLPFINRQQMMEHEQVKHVDQATHVNTASTAADGANDLNTSLLSAGHSDDSILLTPFQDGSVQSCDDSYDSTCDAEHQGDHMDIYPAPVPAEEDSAQAARPAWLRPVKERSLLESLRSVNFWLIFVSTFCGAGSGLTMINNVAQICRALHPDNPQSAIGVVMLGFGSFLGRMGCGVLSDRVKWTRPTFSFLALSSMTIAYGAMAIDPHAFLYPSLAVVGIAYGTLSSANASMIGDLYGPTNHAANYGAIDFSNMIGSLFFATWLVNLFYVEDPVTATCAGVGCFHNTFVVCTGVCAFASVLTAFLTYRSQIKYKRIRHYAHLNTNASH